MVGVQQDLGRGAHAEAGLQHVRAQPEHPPAKEGGP